MAVASSVPEPQYALMRAHLGDALLAELLQVSVRSVQRYTRGERVSPDEVLVRLRWLVRVVDDLRGSYNEAGTRQWFHRPRAQLGGLCSKDFLGAGWLPDTPKAMRAQKLASELSGAASGLCDSAA